MRDSSPMQIAQAASNESHAAQTGVFVKVSTPNRLDQTTRIMSPMFTTLPQLVRYVMFSIPLTPPETTNSKVPRVWSKVADFLWASIAFS